MRQKVKDTLEPLTHGIIKDNATFRLVLGACPTLAVTTSGLNGLYMGLATTFVLVCSNAIISLLRKIIPRKVRIPCYILVIATFSTIVEMVMRKFLPEVYDVMGLFLSLIVVNCILLARAESFSSLNPLLPSVMDGIGIGVGFTMSLTLMGLFREFFGAGSFFGLLVPFMQEIKMTVFVLPAGGFMVFGLLMVLYNLVVGEIEKVIHDHKHRHYIRETNPLLQAQDEEEQARRSGAIGGDK